ncbi:MAG: peptidyl-dipeptidase Dcp [Ignavibacteria bacterium]|nr:MAG: peptidyl-dipeptidase Dcp [Ignavibacteria bacterium]KAF0158341.1 MAG: peptidyl-dipeptidase Dcp [Ignavibacteria bacterium]
MNRKLFLFTLILIGFSLTNIAQENKMENPFFNKWSTPFETPPFNSIKPEHFLPAFNEGVRLEKAEIDAIINNKEKPTFKNTIIAMEKTGEFLTKVNRVFFGLNSANTNDELQKIARTVTPILSKHRDDINLNEQLFEKIKTIYKEKESLKLSQEELTTLENYYSNFVRSGANLNSEGKDKLRKINQELSMLGLRFSENLLKETNAIALVIDKQEDLNGLPDDVKNAAKELAAAKGYQDKWAFSLQKPSFIPFLTYSKIRDLREKVFKSYINRGNNNNEADNKNVIARIVSLRVDKANLLGYKTHADFVLEKNMAKNAEAVYKFLLELWEPALKRAKMESADLQNLVYKDGAKFKIAAWDWWFYAERLKKEKYDLDEAMLRPYFKMENVRTGAFEVASKLFGIKFIPRNDIQVYHSDVEVFEVQEADGKHIGIFYSDYYPRDGKRSGAWASGFRSQSNIESKFITPLVYNVGNFSKPTKDKPALMSIDEVNTLFHELGHGLNSLFQNSVYPGARFMPRDFVELPSQIMEHWALEPAVLKMYAKHYQTGDVIPNELISKLENSRLFNQGFETVEYLAASFLDMDWHTLTDNTEKDVPLFEKESLTKIGLIPEIEARYQTTNFGHITGGYSAGYYSYIWAAVLDADAFQAFKETSLFDKKYADAFREYILAKGGTEDPMISYKKFRGREPKVESLLKKRGLN